MRANFISRGQFSRCVLLCSGMAVGMLNADTLENYQVTDFLKGDAKNQRFSHRFGYHGRIYRQNLLNYGKQSESVQNLETLSLVSDWFPGKGQFHFSAGVIYQERSAKNRPVNLSWNIPQQLNVSNLSIRGDEEGLTPYVGLGWNRGSGPDRRLGLNLDVGVLYQPDGSLYKSSATSSLYNGTTSTILKDFEEVELVPTFSFGLSYSF